MGGKKKRIINDKEARTAVFGLMEHNSPSLDTKELYLGFLNGLKKGAVPRGKNTSVIKLIYKKNGEVYFLTDYRPISLINVDFKILTKILANRLKLVLPFIIHWSQTTLYGGKIDDTVYLSRDLIQLKIDKDQAASIFLDQENERLNE